MLPNNRSLQPVWTDHLTYPTHGFSRMEHFLLFVKTHRSTTFSGLTPVFPLSFTVESHTLWLKTKIEWSVFVIGSILPSEVNCDKTLRVIVQSSHSDTDMAKMMCCSWQTQSECICSKQHFLLSSGKGRVSNGRSYSDSVNTSLTEENLFWKRVTNNSDMFGADVMPF